MHATGVVHVNHHIAQHPLQLVSFQRLHVCFCWVPMGNCVLSCQIDLQAQARVHRLGQTKEVRCLDFSLLPCHTSCWVMLLITHERCDRRVSQRARG